jgi:cytochrome c oxidase subunit 4
MADGQAHFGHAHIAPPSMYIKVFAALIVGTLLTVAAAKVDMGPLNNVVMLLIAGTKATLVILFFMHVRWSSRLTWVIAMAGFFWLLLLFSVIGDYISRGWVPGTLR